MHPNILKMSVSREEMFRTALFLLDLLFIVALLAIPLAWLFHPLRLTMGPLHLRIGWGLKPILAPLVLLAARMVFARLGKRQDNAPQSLMKKRSYKCLVLVLISIYLFVAAMESALAAIRFKAELPPIIFVGKDNQGGVIKSDTLPDAKLMFKYKPGSMFAGRRINSMGFREREVDPKKKPGSIRVICMGNSVAAQGRPGYSQYLHEHLSRNPPTSQSWEAFNMAMHGYSSLQGRTLFRLRGKVLAPDLVVISYGWNDGWLSPKTDRQQMGMEMEPWAGRLFDLLREKRLFQFMVWTMNPLSHMARLETHKLHSILRPATTNTAPDPFEGFVFRVSPQEYRATLTAFVSDVHAIGAFPLLMTEASRKLPQEWADGRQYRTVEEGNRMHNLYMNIMREVARQQHCDLLDLAAIFAGPECNAYFAEDGVHYDFYAKEGVLTSDPPHQPGLERIAEELDKKIRAIVGGATWRSAHAGSRRGAKDSSITG